MRFYENVDMNGQQIKNCPSIADDVAIQMEQPSDEHIKLWIIPEYEREVEIEVPVEGSETGETTTEIYIEKVPASILYRGEDGKLHNMDSIAGAPGENGADGFSPTINIDDLLNDNGEKLGVKLSIVDKEGAKSTNIFNGTKGETGVGITSVDKTGTAGLVDTYTITFSDNTTTTFCITNAKSVEKLSELENDSEFITNTIDNLVNYYTKEETYNKDEVTELLSNISAGLSTKIVTELPDAATEEISLSTIYLVQVGDSNVYTQYMWISGGWANLGTTSVNLENYYTKGEIDTKLGLYVSTTALLAILDNYVKIANIAKVAISGDYNDLKNLPEIPDMSGLASTAYVDNKAAEIEGKIPDASSFRKKTDIIQYSEISGTPSIDTAISTTSENAVQNKVIQAALEKLQYYQAGETLDMAGSSAVGQLTNSWNQVRFFIPLPRDITKRNVTINTPWTIDFRCASGGYLMPSASAASYEFGKMTSTTYSDKIKIIMKKRTTGLDITFESTTRWYSGKNVSPPNNIPVTAEFQKLSFKLT